MKCTFPECVKNVNIPGRDICDDCFNKVVNYETNLDKWLSQHHPHLILDDVIGWYTKCIRTTCQRDCLEPNDICECCPHFLVTRYQRFKIDNNIMPTRDFLSFLYKHS